MLDHARQALDQMGAAGVAVTERVIDDAGAARMLGSRTVLFDGRDLFGTSDAEASLSCRLYPTATGFAGAPSVDDLLVALAQVRADCCGLRGRGLG